MGATIEQEMQRIAMRITNAEDTICGLHKDKERLRSAMQKIADLPLTQDGNRRDVRLRARRIAVAALRDTAE